MDQISFFELLAGWSPNVSVFVGLFAFALFAMAAITLITAPVNPHPRLAVRSGARISAFFGRLLCRHGHPNRAGI